MYWIDNNLNWIELIGFEIVLKCIELIVKWIIDAKWSWNGNWNLGPIEFESNWTVLKWTWLSVWIDISVQCCLGSAPEEFLQNELR